MRGIVQNYAELRGIVQNYAELRGIVQNYAELRGIVQNYAELRGITQNCAQVKSTCVGNHTQYFRNVTDNSPHTLIFNSIILQTAGCGFTLICKSQYF